MLKKGLLGLVVLSGLVAAYVAFQPPGFRIERSIRIAAPPDVVFPHVNALRRWDAWSPWAHRDPGMRQHYRGPGAGIGAVYTWAGNSDVGAGRLMILESVPPERIAIQLDFREPMQATNHAEFTFEPDGDGTLVRWTMTGTNEAFFGKALVAAGAMDHMVGGDFEQGLAALRTVVESAPHAAPPAPAP